MTIRPAPQPPFSAELLADLHADNLPADVSTELWPLVRADPEALAVIEALDAVTAKLGELGRDHDLAAPMPVDVLARIEQALAAETTPDEIAPNETAPADVAPEAQGASGAVVSLDAARTRRARRLTISARTGLLAAAALAVIAGATGLVFGLRGSGQQQSPMAAPPSTATGEPGVEFSAQSVEMVLSQHTTAVGPLSDPAAMHACLVAVHADRPLLGSIDARYHGRDAVLIVVRSTHPRQVTALVVPPTCGPDNAQLLASADF